MFPGEFIKRIKTQTYIDSELLVKSLSEPSPVSIRTNPGKWSKIPADAEPVPWCKTGFYLHSRPSFTLDPLFHSGCYYPRDASGMFLEHVFKQIADHHPVIRILDLCAAPGGKSTQLTDLAGPGSLVIANEVIRSRSVVLSETLTKWGSENVIVTQNDPSVFRRLTGYFDMVMIDAPCSGEGMFRDRIAVDEWSVASTRLCEERQKRIISDIWPSLKEGALLVYSTCTFNPGENEDNIRWLLRNNHAECLKLDISGFSGITEIDLEGIFGYGFYPGKIRGEGFFISVVRKTGKQEPGYLHTQVKNEYKPDKKDVSVADRWIKTDQGRLFRKGEELIMLGCSIEEFMYLFRNLNVVKAGTLISVRKKDNFLPSHDLALSQEIKNDAFPSFEMDYNEALSYLRRDNLSIDNLHDGWNLLTFKDVNIGFVKNIGRRVNNYFPVNWRIRMNIPEQAKENIINWDELN